MTTMERTPPKAPRKRLLMLLAGGLVLLGIGVVWRLMATDAVTEWRAARLSDDGLAREAAQPGAPVTFVLEWGKRLEANARFPEAERVYSRAMEIAPDRAEAWLGLGRAAIATRDWGRANAALAKAVEQWPESADAHFTYASVLAGTFRTRKAIEQLKLGINLDASRGKALLTLGDLQMTEGEAAAAAESYARARKLLPKEKGLQGRYGAALVSVGKFVQAKAELEAALKEDPSDMNARFNLGKALAGTGNDVDRATALRELNRVIEFSNNKSGAYTEAGRMWLAEGDGGNAIQALEHAHDFNPENLDTLALLAKAYKENGRQAEAGKISMALAQAKSLQDERASILSKLDAGEDNIGNLIRLGRVDIRAHKLTEAHRALEAATLLDPNNADAASELKNMTLKGRR